MKNRPLLIATSLAGLLLSGCGAAKIGRINADPMRYRNRTVRIEGTVTNAVGALVAGGYQVQDDTGKIYVISTGTGVPAKGSRVKVSGTVMNGVTLGTRSFGTAIRESSHKVRFYCLLPPLVSPQMYNK
jgi:hypothetical protein